MSGSGRQQALLALFGRLDAERRAQLMAFAAELAAGTAAPSPEALRPEPRVPGETVVMAIRRLVRTYPLPDRRRLMGRATELMGQHALQGRAADEVIAELEAVFEQHYRTARKTSAVQPCRDR